MDEKEALNAPQKMKLPIVGACPGLNKGKDQHFENIKRVCKNGYRYNTAMAKSPSGAGLL